ncbi:hypothetical protein D4T62_10490 [Salmonella enterica subsp. enterica]|nr:hypothetical protein [Salmonella enterica subsp. enterica]EDR3673566.1 hypothetical protein [Salmonella enterica subsp. arizonae serovar 40:z4,z24:]
MTEGIRPDGQIFASSAAEGELQNFPAETRGWGVTIDGKDASGDVVTEPTNGIPPMEWMNGILNKLSGQIFWNMQHAIPAWAAGTWDAGAFVIYSGYVYYNNSGAETTATPGSDSAWVLLFPVTGPDSRYLQTNNSLSEIAAAGTQQAARDNLGLGSASTSNSGDFLPIHGTADAATKLATAHKINGHAFDGSADINVTSQDIFNGQAINIASGTDLNSLMTPGIYYNPANANATSALHYPSTNAGSLLVLKDAGIAQIYTEYAQGNGNKPRQYRRGYYANVWSAWEQVYDTGNPPPPPDLSAYLTTATANSTYQKINTASKASNGWFQDSNTGMIFQWGKLGSSSDTTVTFPIAFPAAIVSVVTTCINDGEAGNASTVQNLTNTSFTLHAAGHDNYWIAIGY